MTKKDHADFNFVAVTVLPFIYLLADLLATGSYVISFILTGLLTVLTLIISLIIWLWQIMRGHY